MEQLHHWAGSAGAERRRRAELGDGQGRYYLTATLRGLDYVFPAKPDPVSITTLVEKGG